MDSEHSTIDVLKQRMTRRMSFLSGEADLNSIVFYIFTVSVIGFTTLYL